MDRWLLRWATAINRRRPPSRTSLPVLWLFTDAARLADPRAAVSRLPKRLAGVVFRHDGQPGRAGLAGSLAQICRARGLPMVVAGDPRLAARLGAGVHLRGGKWPSALRSSHGWVTSSAHSITELRRARRAGADLVFLSPLLATASHPGAASLGVLRWLAMARGAGLAVAALGGVDGRSIRRLPYRSCRAAGAITALL